MDIIPKTTMLEVIGKQRLSNAFKQRTLVNCFNYSKDLLGAWLEVHQIFI